MIWTALHPRALDLLGYIPDFLSAADPRPAREQLHTNYAHGGGWHPFSGFTFNPATLRIKSPGGPAFGPVASATLRNETILVYPYAWVLVLQADGSYEISRMD